MPILHESKHTKLMTSLMMNLLLAVFCRQSLSCEVIDESQGDLNSSNRNYFPFCPRWPISIIFQSFRLDLLCANLATPLISYLLKLFSNLRCARRMIHPRYCLPAPSPAGLNFQRLLLVCESGHSNSAWFRLMSPRTIISIHREPALL